VYGVLTTQDAVGPVGAPLVAGTLVMYLAIYVLLLVAYIGTLFYLARKAHQGGQDDPEHQDALGIERKSVFINVDKVNL
jgi:cytochrome d ubiquinol oxidase subunit I